MFLLGFVVLAGVLVLGGFIYRELAIEARFGKTYGREWQAKYEQAYGTLAAARTKMGVAGLGIVTIICGTVWLARVVAAPQHASGRRKRKHSHRHHSELERLTSYRKRALLGIYFGLFGIGLAILLVLFRTGLFAEHSNEVALGIFVFLGGYAGVITGSGYWLKAKGWNEAIVFIGFMPLVVLLIPFVRLIFLAVPALLPGAMTMMPLILVVVVATLPDKSGAAGRKPWRIRSTNDWGSIEDKGAAPETDSPAPYRPIAARGGSTDAPKQDSGSGEQMVT